mmetsp:Transcript_19386/g.34876  ORF Transcript_19386/g.34876 Transcript_19386/m.34876 type:complete len:1024 (+) Transcript_19386:2-3073(+)
MSQYSRNDDDDVLSSSGLSERTESCSESTIGSDEEPLPDFSNSLTPPLADSANKDEGSARVQQQCDMEGSDAKLSECTEEDELEVDTTNSERVSLGGPKLLLRRLSSKMKKDALVDETAEKVEKTASDDGKQTKTMLRRRSSESKKKKQGSDEEDDCSEAAKAGFAKIVAEHDDAEAVEEKNSKNSYLPRRSFAKKKQRSSWRRSSPKSSLDKTMDAEGSDAGTMEEDAAAREDAENNGDSSSGGTGIAIEDNKGSSGSSEKPPLDNNRRTKLERMITPTTGGSEFRRSSSVDVEHDGSGGEDEEPATCPGIGVFHPKYMLKSGKKEKMATIDSTTTMAVEKAAGGEVTKKVEGGDSALEEGGEVESSSASLVKQSSFRPKKMVRRLQKQASRRLRLPDRSDAQEEEDLEEESDKDEDNNGDDGGGEIGDGNDDRVEDESAECSLEVFTASSSTAKSDIPGEKDVEAISEKYGLDQPRKKYLEDKVNEAGEDGERSTSNATTLPPEKGNTTDVSLPNSSSMKSPSQQDKVSKTKARSSQRTLDAEKMEEDPTTETSQEEVATEDNCGDGEGVTTTPKKNGMKQRKKLLLSAKSASIRMSKKVLDVTAETVASVTHALDETTEMVAEITADITIARPSLSTSKKSASTSQLVNHRAKSPRTRKQRRGSRKDKLARERALRRREKGASSNGGGGSSRRYSGRRLSTGGISSRKHDVPLPPVADQESNDSVKTELSGSIATESEASVVDVNEERSTTTEWSDKQRGEVDSHRKRHVRQQQQQPMANFPRHLQRSISPRQKSKRRQQQQQRHIMQQHHSARGNGRIRNKELPRQRTQQQQHQPHQTYENADYNTYNNNNRGGTMGPQQQQREEHHPISWDDLDDAIEAGIHSSLRDLNSQEHQADHRYERRMSTGSFQPSRDHHSRQQESINQGGYSGSGGGQPVSWDDLEDAIQVGLQGSLVDLSLNVVQKQVWKPSDAGGESNAEIENTSNGRREIDDKPWKCHVCTYDNEHGGFHCGMCNNSRS